ncbi:pseudouridine synthase [Nanoarchaeota archaeon]
MDRVQKLLSNYGYCSRRKAEHLIEEGRVQVNGKVITIGDKASEKDKIYVDGHLVPQQEKVYIMFHKPVRCVTALRDKEYRTVMDYIHVKERVFPVGRLDFNTSGLLILTNDGDFANNMMHPRYEIKKTYVVGLYGKISTKQINEIEKGVSLEDGKTRPASLKVHDSSLLEITIHEGKNRIVRRIMKHLGLKIKFLHRIRVGNLGIGKLKAGESRKLNEKEIKNLRNNKN